MASSAQCRRLLERLARGPINSFQIMAELSICRPSARIRDLRAAGHEIRTHRQPAADAQGVEHQGVAHYHLQSLAPRDGEVSP
ncbi:helix-turn-helix domain-containing protein [Azotobacter chroococcum]|uniref:helix-turn-helix domain-containing protein n=1 Tax=Azotobacter chroococcum TaxID=353 RepID=UPI00201D5B09|nr:helix-turn-helix domain-containing protein [Azotobacter chroococcum]